MMRTLISKCLQRLKVPPEQTPDGRAQSDGVPDELSIEVDHDGSPVSKRPSEWFVCFVPGLQKQWWHRFTHPRHKHVFALKMIGDHQWVIFEPWWNRIMVTALTVDEAVKFLRWGAAGSILKVTERIPGDGSQARGWANCAVQISLMLGRSYWTWTPHGLYKRLLAEDGVKSVDLANFLEEKLISVTRKMAGEGLGDVSGLTKLSPVAAFTELGKRICRILFSPRYLSLYRLAVSETSRFPAAAAAFFAYGPLQVAASVKALISHFCETGQFRNCDREKLSRAFMSMLRGNLYLETALESKVQPDEKDLESRTKSVVEVFLRGIEELPAGALRNRRIEVFASGNERIRLRPIAHIERAETFANTTNRVDAYGEVA
ncbi:MAG TPA: TetR/AcrR family transcriptional regulator C-terminal domain-containing protein [Terracidiphilus sp.]|jgi:hypothetical protein